MALLLFVIYLVFSMLVLSRNLQAIVWEVGSGIYLILATFVVGISWLPGLVVWLAIIAIAVVIRVDPVREYIADIAYKRAKKSIPKLSKTEETALNAGDTWLEKDIFIGEPDWDRLASVNTDLSKEEKAFIDNETQVLCGMIDEWAISQEKDMPESVWQYIKEKGFLGLVIDKKYGGKGFSARAHSDVVMKIATRSATAAVTVMVPNSLGPGELLSFYGTEKQKSYYLPRLAKGEEIPCFALTEPGAGSDATSIKSEAVVVEKTVDGKKLMGLDLTLNKRWITLAPVATLIGLAVNLRDPKGLLKGKGQEGITCLLIARDTKNLEIGNRHLPGNQPFMNGTIRGENIFVPIDSIIGGQEQAGNGWQMLVECLSIGRSISLPALATASSSVSYMTTGAFSRIRRQFNIEIAQFEGIEEKLAEIAGWTYLVNATRLLTVAAVQEHKKPSVASAITKYFNTELYRKVVNSAMDVHAGRAVVVGPRNYLVDHYQSIPISITVEGANIMTRNLLIFGQGSMACHPYVRDEFYAVSHEDKSAFQNLIWQHIQYTLSNTAKAFLSTWSSGRLIGTPGGSMKRYYQQIARLSHAFAWLADLSLIVLGGSLKRKERLSARLADAMSHLYMGMAALRLYEAEGQNPDFQLHAQWAVQYCLYQAQKAMIEFCQNFPNRFLGMVMRLWTFPFGQTLRYPKDKIDSQLAQKMANYNDFRSFIQQFVYLSGDSKQPVDRMEYALKLLVEHQPLYQKVGLKGLKFAALKDKLQELVKNGKLSQTEMDALVEVEHARWDAIQVDEFKFDDMKKKRFDSVVDKLHNPLD
ncbi:acyl-CoA dehydrogenase [Legionella sp. W05-934-2]|uniref:acyl-CoA dehydrogenase n=1 Tax=Legionella sp. W05-934-2 TaxID=1198649 RepID=UPI00346321A8